MHFSKVSAAVLLALLPATIASPHGLFGRDSSTGQCGAANGGLKCDDSAVNACCSAAGWCGDSAGHCGTGCQAAYGKCGGVPDYTPGGGSTSGVPRTKLGSVPYGADIYDCAVPGTIALTFDDGPWIYTNEILDVLKEFNAKATFFITGSNLDKGAIDDPTLAWANIIRRMESDGHQIASHTWTHPDLSTLSEAARRDEMYKNEMALRNILGKFPTYMRPPFSSCTADCVRTMQDLGYHIIYFDLDTDDYNNDSPDLIQNARNNFSNAVDGTNPAEKDFLAIAHDIHEQTARNLTRFMLEDIKKNGYRTVTVGECFGDSKDNWYRS
ncbi:glycoside hydrolase/deacetylase [Choiromyces venosus 120613-1]|uniref:Glycoside hydrolase/deacetylase n=1 Tax=Choiromyces venosus 120613-1 TaxID=1336337 RepID=A0A3N4K0Y3_9PEZI|nr:glycoside hydrolase/deacetylase [Choiromyces venosus 120613-1]